MTGRVGACDRQRYRGIGKLKSLQLSTFPLRIVVKGSGKFPNGPAEVAWTARKVWDLRLLRDEQSASDVGAPVLVVSQFTLYGDARKGRRPTWQAAAPGPASEPVYQAVCAELERLGAHVERGRFGADMRVESVNDGPITLVLDSPHN